MYLVNGFLRTLTFIANGFKTIFLAIFQGASSHETRPLLHHEPSLTSRFEDYEHSHRAVRTCLLHGSIYYTIAIVSFSFVVERWPIIDSLYYATVLFTTIGYGDIFPSTNAARVITMFLALYGITILGVFLGIYGGSLVEANEQSVKDRQRKFKKDVVNRIEGNTPEGATGNGTEEEEEEAEPSMLRDIWDILVLETPIIIVVVVLGQILGYFEGWDVIESLYWTVITGTTVGFGDDSPHKPGVRLAAVFFLPLAVAVLGEFLGRVAGAYVDRKRRLAEKKFFAQSLTLADLKIMDVDNNGHVDRAEFLAYMLVTLQRVEPEEIDSLLKLFNKLDRDANGALSAADLMTSTGRSLRQASIGRSMRDMPEGGGDVL